jgi:DNA helicase-2/ATP-dependent DNA helicase PcrA
MEKNDYKKFADTTVYGKYLKKNPTIHASGEESAFSGDAYDLYTWLKNTCTPFEHWKRYPGIKNIVIPPKMVVDFLKDYEKYKKEIGKIDFTDMLQCVIDEEIKIDTSILMVDEFQDFTAQMYKIFEMWVPHCEHVLIAGDPYQSIYEFWGGCTDYYYQFDAVEIIRPETFRLTEQVKNFSHEILRSAGMIAPDTKAKHVDYESIKRIRYDADFPVYDTEFHLVRCNYQALPVVLKLANDGKVFSGLYEWTEDERNAANALISVRQGKSLTFIQTKAILDLYPANMLGVKGSKQDYFEELEKRYVPQLQTGTGILNAQIIDSLRSSDPTKGMTRDGRLFQAKINGIKNRKEIISKSEVQGRKVLTIHGAKGLEATAVFLHNGITPRIRDVLLTPCKEKQAEVRVWYVGATRPKNILFLVLDTGNGNYQFPPVPSMSETVIHGGIVC